jgi:hypothetical protein
MRSPEEMPQNENPEPGSDAIRTEKLFRPKRFLGALMRAGQKRAAVSGGF